MSLTRLLLSFALMAPFFFSTADARPKKHLGDLTGPWILLVDDYAIAWKTQLA